MIGIVASFYFGGVSGTSVFRSESSTVSIARHGDFRLTGPMIGFGASLMCRFVRPVS